MFSLFISVVTSVISGIYSGLIVARYTRFSDLRSEVLRVIRSINYMDEGNGIVSISGVSDLSKLHLVKSDLFFLKHIDAAHMISTLIDAINKTNIDASAGRLLIHDYEERYQKWQFIARTLSPQKKEIFGFGWKL